MRTRLVPRAARSVSWCPLKDAERRGFPGCHAAPSVSGQRWSGAGDRRELELGILCSGNETFLTGSSWTSSLALLGSDVITYKMG